MEYLLEEMPQEVLLSFAWTKMPLKMIMTTSAILTQWNLIVSGSGKCNFLVLTIISSYIL